MPSRFAHLLLTVLLVVVASVPVASPAAAAPDLKVAVDLVAATTTVRPGESARIALRQVITPGWHTYWRNPGDSGQATSISWNPPDGVTVSDILWPFPERIPYGPLVNHGYHGEILLPMDVTLADDVPAGDLVLSGRASWLVCEDICIPEDADVQLTLTVADEPPAASVHAAAFAAVAERLPRPTTVASRVADTGDALSLEVDLSGLQAERIRSVHYFPYVEGAIEYGAPQPLAVSPNGLSLGLTKGWDYNPEADLAGIIVVEEDAGGAVTMAFEIQPGSPVGGVAQAATRVGTTQAAADTGAIGLLTAAMLAFLGGMILNLMPCVFPVLSIKIMSLLEQVEAHSQRIRLHGLAYLAGVVLSFVAIATVLIVLREGGARIGWGFQLQQPLVVAALVYLFFALGLSLSGVFHIGAALQNTGNTLATREGLSGSFFTGVLATVVAAPCTAPFMGAAVGYALTQSPAVSLLVFASLGLGMAVPYVALTFSPPLIRRLPRPGAWMERMKELFAFPMYGTAVWLLWVLNQQTGPQGLVVVLSGLVLLTFGIWLLHNLAANNPWRVIGQVAGIVVIVGAVTLAALQPSPSVKSASTGTATTPYEAYTESKLDEYLAAGPVFVNFTAAWCITCKFNEVSVLNTAEVRGAFEEYGIRYLKGDWTNEDPVITAALERYGRSGVPLYLVYEKDSSEAAVLPQVLTVDAVVDALAAAAG